MNGYDFFLKSENLRLVRESGCIGLFSGIESFDINVLQAFNKKQNTCIPQVEIIRECLEAGLVFFYGVIFDLTRRRISECREELDFLLATPTIALPAFVTQAIPLLGTPYFYECLENDLFLPNVKLRDMDGSTLVQRPLDPIDEVTAFLHDLTYMRGYRRSILLHCARFLRRYHTRLNTKQLASVVSSAAMLIAPTIASSPKRLGLNRNTHKRTFVCTTEVLDDHYRPAFLVDSRYEHYFKPTIITDGGGYLADEVAEDLLTQPGAVDTNISPNRKGTVKTC